MYSRYVKKKNTYSYANGNNLISFNIKNDKTKATLTYICALNQLQVNQQQHKYEYEKDIGPAL